MSGNERIPARSGFAFPSRRPAPQLQVPLVARPRYRLQRDVAVKILPASVAGDSDRLTRFEREARLLASLNHPNIGAIYGVEDHPPALVLELIDGVTLADRIAAGPLPVDECLRLARQIAIGLDAAHEKNMIHRDLKPANIKVTPDGIVKILDFGIAKVVSVDPHAAATITSKDTRACSGLM